MLSSIIAGKYQGAGIKPGYNNLTICKGLKRIKLDRSTVESYELITDDHRKSAASGVGRGLIGGALLGPVGMLAGGLSAKNKGVYQVAIQYYDGNKSLLQLNDKDYNTLIRIMF